MILTIKIKMDNAAFDGDYQPEVQRILRDLADDIDYKILRRQLHDINGNQVGTVTLTGARGR